MEAYAEVLPDVPPEDWFARSAAMFSALTGELAGPAAAGLTASEAEELVIERSREHDRQVLQDYWDMRAAKEAERARRQARPVTGPDQVPRTRLETGHGRALATLLGVVNVDRCAWRRPGAPDWLPADADRSLPAGRYSYPLLKTAVTEAVRGSFDDAHDAVTRRCGNVMGKRQIEESVVDSAADIAAFYAARVPEPCTPGTVLAISADCKGIAMRLTALRKATAKAAAAAGKLRTRLSAGEKANRKRMACLVTVYDAEPAGRRPQDIIAPPGGRHGTREPRPGPKAQNKWLAGSVRRDPADMIAAAFDEAEARDPGHQRTWVVLVDGAEHQLNLIRAEAARRGVSVHVLIDIIHVIEYIWDAMWSLRKDGEPADEDWVAAKALTVLAGHSDRAAREIAAEAEAAGLKPGQRTGAAACIRYLTGKRDFLRYDQALAAGWPIATGVIEGACRHLIGDRLAITGCRWGLDGAEAILTLRAVISNGDFDDYWRFHLEREHQRLYPGAKQGQYTLGA